MRLNSLVLLTVGLCVTCIIMQGQDTTRTIQKSADPLRTAYAKGLKTVAPDSSYSLKFGFRFQNLLMLHSMSDNTGQIDPQMMVRRARLKFDGFAFDPSLVYKVELALSNNDVGNPVPQGSRASNIVLDAVVKWKFARNTSLWFGQTKLPGNRERVISSQALQFVDRSNLNGEYNIDRDLGIHLHHQFKLGNVLVRDIYALTRGEGRNLTNVNMGGLDYTARIEVLPFGAFTKKGDYVSSDIYREQSPKLSIAATYDYNDEASKEQGQLGDFLSGYSDLETIFADLMFKYRGFSLMAEYADKSASRAIVYDELGKPDGVFVVGKGYSIQGGYLLKSNWELAARYTHVDPLRNIGLDATWMYTFGLSRYIVGHNLKFQTDISLTDVEFSTPHKLMFRFQTEVAF